MSCCSPRVRCLRRVMVAGLVAGAATLLVSSSAHAQESPYTLIHKFYSGPRIPVGRLVETVDGSLFGTTLCGGEPEAACSGGTIFALRPQGDGSWRYEDVHHLRPGLHGANPASGLTLARDGSLYGIASRRGRPFTTGSWGAIFRVNPGGSLTPVHVFDGSDGLAVDEKPTGRVMEGSDGNLYGATCYLNGFPHQGRVYRLTPAGAISTVYLFPKSATGNPADAPEAACPITQLHEAADGSLFGTSLAGGTYNPLFPQFPPRGTLFRVNRGTTPATLSVLHTFRGLDGNAPTGEMTPGASGEFFGTTMAGGLFGQGVVYRRDAAGAVRTVHTFFGANGSTPFGGLFRAADGAFYGTTAGGGSAGQGTLFRMGASGFASLHSFTGSDGSAPIEVMQARDGNLYGVTTTRGPTKGGTVYRVGPGNTLTTVHAFAAGAHGPALGVIQASDGNFYGTTRGGNAGGGSVYRMTPSGQVTVLHEFDPPAWAGVTGAWIRPSGVIEASDGFLYGRTTYGGTNDWGIAYRITPAGVLTVLHSFDKYAEDEGLIQASDGNFYGVTTGDSQTAPTIFRMDPAGHVTTIHTIVGSPASLHGPLAEGPDGALYGIGFLPGAGAGGLFRVTTSGTFTLVYTFDGSAPGGYIPTRGLIRGRDGALYGSTTQSGSLSPAGIFRFDATTNTLSPVAPIAASAPLAEGPDGALYSFETQLASPRNRLRFFRVLGGEVEILHVLGDDDGYWPSQLTVSTDGFLYGTVSEGASRFSEPETWPADAFAGGVFRLAIPPKK